MDEKKINRLILLGNGFDLAHNLKTSYNDFIRWYLIKCLTYAQNNMRYNDELLSVFVQDISNLRELSRFQIDDVESFVAHFYDKGFSEVLKQTYFKFKGWQNDWPNPFEIKIQSKLIEKLILNCSAANWVDIENIYYDELKLTLSSPSKQGKKHDIDELNDSLGYIIKQLEEYLCSLNIGSHIDDYSDIIRSAFNSEEFVDKISFNSFNTKIDSTLIVNFNYTSTIEQYIDHKSILDINIDVNYIHGKLKDKYNNIIFGFGDELDSEYLGFELDRTKGIFDYIKSFWYFKTSNYHNLIRFIESNDFQVYILGHSCGLSDRTMLNMIFEHDNCKSIKIFYHQTDKGNNYTALTHEISRHFKDKQKMRRRIVPFDKSSSMPQTYKTESVIYAK